MKLVTKALSYVAFASAFILPVYASPITITFADLPGANATVFSTYSESGYTVTNLAGQFYVGKIAGDPVPDLFAGPYYGSAVNSVMITMDGGGSFDLDSFDGASFGGVTAYDVTGSLMGSPVYDVTGMIPQGVGFVTADAGEGSHFVNSVVIQYATSNGSANLDNIVVDTPAMAATPEPSSLVLLATGLLGAAGAARRRLRSA